MKIAAAQIAITADIERNAEKILHAIDKASSAGAKLILFPETALTGYLGKNASQHSLDDANSVDNKLEKIRISAHQNSICVAIGSATYQPNTRPLNSLCLSPLKLCHSLIEIGDQIYGSETSFGRGYFAAAA